MTKKPLVIHIYRDMLKQAEIFRQKAEKAKEIHNELETEMYYFVSDELYFWVAELEKTEEVNPTN